MKKYSLFLGLLILFGGSVTSPYPALAARAPIPKKVGDPYLGAIVVNADSGEVVFEDNADTRFYPASIIKLMMLLLFQEKIEQKALRLSDPVLVTAQAARTGGSQVYLKEKEVFPIEELLYALITQSANDAAVALAIHVAGSTDAFAEMMQDKARELGLKNTEFHSVHGLPPSVGQKPDISTPRDLAKLSRELLKHPDILRYTSTRLRGFRNDTFEMRSHNHLLDSFKGCDGLKTGYFRAAGFSIVASARHRGARFLAVVAGSRNKKVRDSKARELLAKAFSSHPYPQPTVYSPAEARKTPVSPSEAAKQSPPTTPEKGRYVRTIYIIVLLPAAAVFFYWLGRRGKR